MPFEIANKHYEISSIHLIFLAFKFSFSNLNKSQTKQSTYLLLHFLQVLFKACVRYFHQFFIFSPNDSPSETIKNAFYSI